jgi:hypothetical protein
MGTNEDKRLNDAVKDALDDLLARSEKIIGSTTQADDPQVVQHIVLDPETEKVYIEPRLNES